MTTDQHTEQAQYVRADVVREVLEGLRMGGKHDGGCWCIESPSRTRQPEWRHNKYCKAASALYPKLQPDAAEKHP